MPSIIAASCCDVQRAEGVLLDKNIRISWLLDFYGEFLTDKQRGLMDMHYNEDLSLAEIAERAGITRQGVHDGLRRGAETLERCEQRLGFMARYLAVKASLDGMMELLEGKDTLCAGDTAELKARLRQAADIWEGGNGL